MAWQQSPGDSERLGPARKSWQRGGPRVPMSDQETLGLVLPPPGDSSDAHPPQPPAPSVTGQPGDPLLCGVSPSLTLLVTLPTSPVTHPR